MRFAMTIALVVYLLTMFVATHVPKIPRLLQPQISDKWQHYVAYALLGGLLALWWSQRHTLNWRAALGLLGVIALYGAFDESTQPLFGRESELLDWRADVVGAATSVALFAAGHFLIPRTGSVMKRRRSTEGRRDKIAESLRSP